MAAASLEDQLTDDLANEVDPVTGLPKRRPAGVSAPVDNTPAPTPAPTPTPAPQKFAIQPVDQGKFDDPNKHDGKYDFLRTMQGFDPTKGFTSDGLAKLNALGYANFSGSGDKLTYNNVTDAGRAAGLEANGFSGDFIQNYGNGANPNAMWAWNWQDSAAPAAASPNPITQILLNRSSPTAGQEIHEGREDPGYTANAVTGGTTPATDTPAAGSATPPVPPGPKPGPDWVPDQTGLGWVPPGHPNAWKPPAGATPGAAADPNAPPPVDTSLEGQIKKMMEDAAAERAKREEYSKKIHDTVTSQIDEGSKPVDPNDPIMAQQNRAYSTTQDRALAEGREAMAARGASQGLPTGAMDASLQSSYENAASDKSAYSGNLMADRLKQKQQQLQNALTTGAGILSAEEARDLQSRIATLDARIKATQIDQNERQGNRDLDIRQGGLDLDNRRLTEQSNQFYDTFGANIGDRESALNAEIMRMLQGR